MRRGKQTSAASQAYIPVVTNRIQRVNWKRGIPLYLMIFRVLFFVIFKYIPMGGLVIAFQEYDPFSGFIGSPWVGLDHFQRLFTDADFWTLLRNTLMLSALNLFCFSRTDLVRHSVERGREVMVPKDRADRYLYAALFILGCCRQYHDSAACHAGWRDQQFACGYGV